MATPLKQLLSLREALRAARAAAQFMILVLLDLLATSDMMKHRILLSILSDMAISNNPHFWFESYLTGHSIKVSWHWQTSRSHRLSTAVPQGSTSLLKYLVASCALAYLVADETQLYPSFPPDDSVVSLWISACLSDISTWMKECYLQPNLS